MRLHIILNFSHKKGDHYFFPMDNSSKDPVKIRAMFSTIADRYDLLNRVLSLGIDRYWRKFAVNKLPRGENALFLDVATGTCDVALEIIKQHSPGTKVVGLDFSEGMLKLGRDKVEQAGLEKRIDVHYADVTALPFDDNVFDASIVAFGIRNVRDFEKGISEMGRVVKSGGKLVILEFTSIQNPLFKTPYRFYIKKILPFIGEMISGKKGAYKYLPSSMLEFPGPEEFKKAMERTGLQDVRYQRLSLGIVAVHIGTVK